MTIHCLKGVHAFQWTPADRDDGLSAPTAEGPMVLHYWSSVEAWIWQEKMVASYRILRQENDSPSGGLVGVRVRAEVVADAAIGYRP